MLGCVQEAVNTGGETFLFLPGLPVVGESAPADNEECLAPAATQAF